MGADSPENYFVCRILEENPVVAILFDGNRSFNEVVLRGEDDASPTVVAVLSKNFGNERIFDHVSHQVIWKVKENYLLNNITQILNNIVNKYIYKLHYSLPLFPTAISYSWFYSMPLFPVPCRYSLPLFLPLFPIPGFIPAVIPYRYSLPLYC